MAVVNPESELGFAVKDDKHRKHLLTVFRPLLRTRLIPTTILFNLTEIIPINDGLEIQRIQNIHGRPAAVDDLLEKLFAKSSENPDWYNIFIRALRNTGNGFLAAYIEGTSLDDIFELDVFTKVIEICAPSLEEINPSEILPYLPCLDEHDREIIRADQDRLGPRCAVLTLLDRLVKKFGGWFKEFVHALEQVGRNDLAQLLTGNNDENAIEGNIDDNIESSNLSNDNRNQIADENQQVEEDITVEGIVTENNVSANVDGENLMFMTNENIADLSNQTVDTNTIDQNRYGNIETQFSHLSINENCNHIADENQMEGLTRVEGNVTENNVSANVDGENVTTENVVELSNQTEKGSNESSQERVYDNVTHQAKKLELRSYQEDLVKSAVEGKNTVICAPTGSGKTYTALHIIKQHLQKGRCPPTMQKPVVVFLVNQKPLVKQQEGVFKEYLEPYYKVIQLTGEARHISLSDVIQQGYDLIVLTAQILENALDRKHIECLSVFSMLVFDECHHTQKKQPFNVIMSRYRDLKKIGSSVRKPQIIGLTASLGVGKAKSTTDAVDHLLKLCANLDAQELSTVRNKNDLEKYVPVPQEDFFNVPGRSNNPFATEINEIMSEIEMIMPARGRYSLKSKERPERGTQDYERWVTHLRKNSTDVINDPEIRRLYKTCTDQLKEYNSCLFVNKEARSKDALDYLDRYFNKLEDLREGFDDLDHELFNKFKDKRTELEKVAKDPQNKNPVLEKLGSLIRDAYIEKLDSRAMLMTKTKASCHALKGWIQDTDDLTDLNPAVLVGSSDSGDIPGMTQEQQTAVLEKFEDGYHRIIVCTSVGQEGIDIKKCNLVLRYNFSTNEIGRIQAKGRSRAEGGKTYLVTRKDTTIDRQEQVNIFREHLMYEALHEITRMSHADFLHKIEIIQTGLEDCSPKARFESKPMPVDPVTFRCERCKIDACLSSDFRVINNSHHIVLDEAFLRDKVVIKKEKDEKKIDDLFYKEGKVQCRKCMYHWGSMARFPLLKDGVFPTLKVKCFELDIPRHGRKQYKKWKEVPFGIEPMELPGKETKGKQRTREPEEE